MSDLPWDEDEDVPPPDDLKDRWEHRDHLYRMRLADLTQRDVLTIRVWRMEEAERLGEPNLIAAAAAWVPTW